MLGKADEAIRIAETCLARSDGQDQALAIIPFFIWMSDEEQKTQHICDGIDALGRDFKSHWRWANSAAYVVEQLPNQQRLCNPSEKQSIWHQKRRFLLQNCQTL